MKRILFIAALLFTIHCSLFTSEASGQSRTNRLTRPCPGSTTPATVSIAVGGNISVTPCSGGTVTINGTVVPQGVKVYRALLTQSGTSAPTATVLENSLGGTVVWTRSAAGSYLATLAGAFPSTKLFIYPQLFYLSLPTEDNTMMAVRRNSDNALVVDVVDATTGVGQDGALTLAPVQILVYP